MFSITRYSYNDNYANDWSVVDSKVVTCPRLAEAHASVHLELDDGRVTTWMKLPLI